MCISFDTKSSQNARNLTEKRIETHTIGTDQAILVVSKTIQRQHFIHNHPILGTRNGKRCSRLLSKVCDACMCWLVGRLVGWCVCVCICCMNVPNREISSQRYHC